MKIGDFPEEKEGSVFFLHNQNLQVSHVFLLNQNVLGTILYQNSQRRKLLKK